MFIVLFLNKKDLLLRSILSSVTRWVTSKKDYIVLSREGFTSYEQCTIYQTFIKIKELAKNYNRLLIIFGTRLLPGALDRLYEEAVTHKGNIVFLKVLKGSKTWDILDNKINFSNYRIADVGVFVLDSKDILESNKSNFNEFIKDLTIKNKIRGALVKDWVFTNNTLRGKK